MRRILATLAVISAAALIAAPAALAGFGFESLGTTFVGPGGSPELKAGSHPFSFTTDINLNTVINPSKGELPDGAAKDISVELPPGLIGTPTPVPPCSTPDFLHTVGLSTETPELTNDCSDSTAIGVGILRVGLNAGPGFVSAPVYNLVPSPGAAAKIGFIASTVPVTVEIGVNPEPPYNVVATAKNVAQAALFYGSKLTLWGNPANPVHNSERGNCAVTETADTCATTAPEKPFLTLPTSCGDPLTTFFKADSWQSPGIWLPGEATSPLGITGCESLGFSPEVASHLTTARAEAPSGLNFNLDINDEGLTSPTGTAQSDIRKAVVTLPKGVTVNPSTAEGLAVCTKEDLKRETVNSEPGAGCPEAAKVGNVEVETPLLEGELLRGSLFVAQPDDPATKTPQAENPFDALLAIYMVIQDPKLGILVKLAGKVEPDPRTGQLVTSFEDIPQFPFAHFRFHFREGARAPLVAPPACGEYQTKAEFSPWSGTAPVSPPSSFEVTSGVNGGPCPAGVPPFRPGFEAGSINNNAGAYSPFYVRLTRQDGEQEMTHFSSVLPPGVTGKLAGVGKCPDAAISAAAAKTGRQELAQPSCPASSVIGHVLAGAGVGSALTYVPGTIYLAGPYGGDPLSAVAITPAVAGPFDVGTVVVREALTLDPTTAEVQVDGSHSDPIPHILKGIPLRLRDLRVYVDRPGFTLNPTSCEPSRVRTTLFGSFADVFNPADDAPVSLSARYQAANCASLRFKPKLSLKLTGGTRRGDLPALRATVDARPGDANIGKAVVTLPHSAFLEQGHIRTVCTRVQFAASACPPGSIYGHARAITPLLDEPLEGPVYLRSSDHPLPDLVAALHGVVDINVVGRIDAVKARLRSSFETPPDAPVSRFVLEMQGGKKGLIVNSANLCAKTRRAKAQFTGQNGRLHEFEPVVKDSCPQHKAKRHARRGSHR